MCGIVGHIGTVNSVDILLNGLSRLEYRGYDSAGICIKNANNQLEVHKKAGKIENLKALLKELAPTATIGIGHTRWATHGGVTDRNAHPHSNEKLAIVHNGIIENGHELRVILEKEGYKFQSETDTEVFLGLLTRYYNQGHAFFDCVREAFLHLKGNFAFVVMCKDSGQIISLKRGAPLVLGTSSKDLDVFVSSDPYALIGLTDQLYFPEDEVICVEELGKHPEFYELSGKKSNRYKTMAQLMNMDVADKGTFEHFMLKEIHEQPERIRHFMSYYLEGEGRKGLEEVAHLRPKQFHISACGTAWHAGLVIRNFIEKYNKIPTSVELASEFRYREPLLSKDEVGIFISQSGETADTLAAMDLCLAQGLKTINIGNVEGSTQYRKAHHSLLIRAGTEIGVASTKAFTLMGLTGFLYSMALAGALKDPASQQKVQQEISLLADRIELLLKNSDQIKDIAEQIYSKKGFLFTGRNVYFPITLEGALKLKEIAYVHAEGYAGGELKHGPIALIDEEMVNVALVGPELSSKMVSNVEEVKARRGIIVSVGPEDHFYLRSISHHYIPLNFAGLPNLSPLLVNVVCQLLSYYMAKFKGTDIDKPRNLAKSVTVE